MILSIQPRMAGKQLECCSPGSRLKQRHLSQDGKVLYLGIHSNLEKLGFKGDTYPLSYTAGRYHGKEENQFSLDFCHLNLKFKCQLAF